MVTAHKRESKAAWDWLTCDEAGIEGRLEQSEQSSERKDRADRERKGDAEEKLGPSAPPSPIEDDPLTADQTIIE